MCGPYVSYLVLVIRCDMMIQYKKPCLKNMCFVVVSSDLILLWLLLKMLFHGNSLDAAVVLHVVPFGTPFFALLCDSEILCYSLLSWNKNIIIPRCEKVIKKPVAPEAAIEDTTTNLLSFIKTQEIVGIFFLQLDLLLPRFL